MIDLPVAPRCARHHHQHDKSFPAKLGFLNTSEIHCNVTYHSPLGNIDFPLINTKALRHTVRMVRIRNLGKAYYHSFLAWVIPPDFVRTSEESIELVHLCHLSILVALFVPAFVIHYAVLGHWNLAAGLTLAGLCMAPSTLLYRKTGKLWLVRELFIIPLFLYLIWETMLVGDVISPSTIWLVATPIVSLLLGGTVSAVTWLVISIAGTIGLYFYLGSHVTFQESSLSGIHFMHLFSFIAFSIALTSLFMMMESAKKTALRQLETANKTIHDIAIRDALTGVYNRRYVWNEITKEQMRVQNGERKFCICLIDIDRFKLVNDNFGHAMGDDVLRTVACTIEKETRQGDCFGRYGGEEFILMIKDSSIEEATQFAERIRKRVESTIFQAFPQISPITISIGVAEYRFGEQFGNTVSRADKALYCAKSMGRNQVRVIT